MEDEVNEMAISNSRISDRIKIDVNELQCEMRKLGTSFITGGMVGFFITHIGDMTFKYMLGSIWIGLLGMMSLLIGLLSVRK